MAVFQRKMDQEQGHIIEFKLDNEALYTGIEIVKPLSVYAGRGKECVALFAYDRKTLVQ